MKKPRLTIDYRPSRKQAGLGGAGLLVGLLLAAVITGAGPNVDLDTQPDQDVCEAVNDSKLNTSMYYNQTKDACVKPEEEEDLNETDGNSSNMDDRGNQSTGNQSQ